MFTRVASVFASAAVRKRARSYLGLLSQQERKNGWTIAEFAGEDSRTGCKRLLNRCAWDDAQAHTADETYSQNPGLRDWLETEKVPYVLVVPCS